MCNTWRAKQKKKCVAQDESIHRNYHRKIKTNFTVLWYKLEYEQERYKQNVACGAVS